MSWLPKDKRTQLLLVACVTVFALFIIGLVSRQTSPSRTTITIDKDTGERLVSEPNKNPEQFNNSGDILVLGSPELLKRGMTQKQFALFRSSLVPYVRQHFPDYDRVKILPDKLYGQAPDLSGLLRLGESKNTLSFTLKAYNLRFIELVVKDPLGKAPDLNTGKLEAPAEAEEYEEVDL